jgi:hypothetical protein
MTQDSQAVSTRELVIGLVLLLLPVAGTAIAVDLVLRTSWWGSLLAGVLVTAGTIAAMRGYAVLLLGPISLYGSVNTVGWVVTLLIVGACFVTLVLHGSDGPNRTPSPESQPPVARVDVPIVESRKPALRTVSDDLLVQYACEFLADGGTRDIRAVITALQSRLRDENLRPRPFQNLSRAAGSALASTRPAAPLAGPRHATGAPSRPPTPRPEVPREPVPRSTRNAREHLHEFSSLEIERVITRTLAGTPGLTDDDLVDRVLAALDVADRSPWALQRLSDVIERLRIVDDRLMTERRSQQQERHLTAIPGRDPEERTKLDEDVSPVGEHTVERAQVVDQERGTKGGRKSVERDLGAEDLSPTGQEERRLAQEAKAIQKPPRDTKVVKKFAVEAPSPRKATSTKDDADTTVETKEQPDPPAKETAKRTAKKSQRNRADDTAKPTIAPAPQRTPEPVSEVSPPEPPDAATRTSDSGDGTPDAKDIARLLGL